MKKRKPYLGFIAPGFVMYTIFVVVPAVYVIYLSFFEWSGLGPMTFLGLENYKTLLFGGETVTKEFWHALFNNLKYLLCVWLIITPFQYLMAYLLFIRIPCHKYIKFMLFFPYVISSTIVSFFAILVFNPTLGILNNGLKAMNLSALQSAWFGDPGLAFKLLIIMVIWQGAGSGMNIFYASMLDIPSDVMESCRIDGCNEWQRFRYILLPLSLPSCASIITMSSIWAISVFDMPYMLGGAGGGVKGCLDFVNLVFYRYTFGSILNAKSDLGFGATIAAVMFILMMCVAAIQNRILNKLDYKND